MYPHVYMCIYTCALIWVCMFITCIYAHIAACTHMHKHVIYTCVCMDTCVHMLICLCTHMGSYVYAHRYVYTIPHVYIYDIEFI